MKKAGWILSGLAALFFLLDGGMKLAKPPEVVKPTVELGWPESSIVGLGVVLLACTLLYLWPRTAVLGAVLLTGYLGGAVATHVRVGGPVFNILFPVVFGCFVWAAFGCGMNGCGGSCRWLSFQENLWQPIQCISIAFCARNRRRFIGRFWTPRRR